MPGRVARPVTRRQTNGILCLIDDDQEEEEEGGQSGCSREQAVHR